MAMARTRDMVMWQSAFYATMVTGATKKGGGGDCNPLCCCECWGP